MPKSKEEIMKEFKEWFQLNCVAVSDMSGTAFSAVKPKELIAYWHEQLNKNLICQNAANKR